MDGLEFQGHWASTKTFSAVSPSAPAPTDEEIRAERRRTRATQLSRFSEEGWRIINERDSWFMELRNARRMLQKYTSEDDQEEDSSIQYLRKYLNCTDIHI